MVVSGKAPEIELCCVADLRQERREWAEKTLPENVKVYLDVSLKRFETVFPAAGSDNSAVEMTCGELEKYSSNFVEWVDVCKAWRPEEG